MLNRDHVGWRDSLNGPTRIVSVKDCGGASCVSQGTSGSGDPTDGHGTRVTWCSDRSASPDEQDTGTQDAGTPDTGTPDANLEPSSPECGEVPPESAPMAYLPDQHFCIDRTEVTWGQYMAWLTTSPSHDGLPAQCDSSDSFAPLDFCLEKRNVCRAGRDERPMVCVDWCDAHAYCKAMGKRLCGAIGGGPVPFDQYANAHVSQWFAACSSGGKYRYPYGNTFDPKACDGAMWQDLACLERGECPSLAVATLAPCQAPDPPYRGVFDLSGNLCTWTSESRTSVRAPVGRRGQ
ncbi:MAG: formylglycine-generating enzyme family protein [Polyangiaceae bacterium]|nr:formylglycine-generating enzyme family protein [Polyangiaceae bacterium]